MKVMKSGDILCVLGGSSGWLIFSMDFYSTSPIVPLINNYQNYRRAVYRDRHILVRLCDVFLHPPFASIQKPNHRFLRQTGS